MNNQLRDPLLEPSPGSSSSSSDSDSSDTSKTCCFSCRLSCPKINPVDDANLKDQPANSIHSISPKTIMDAKNFI